MVVDNFRQTNTISRLIVARAFARDFCTTRCGVSTDGVQQESEPVGKVLVN
jgi:hypothetical protein